MWEFQERGREREWEWERERERERESERERGWISNLNKGMHNEGSHWFTNTNWPQDISFTCATFSFLSLSYFQNQSLNNFVASVKDFFWGFYFRGSH